MDVRGRDTELAQIERWLRAGTQEAAEPAAPGGVLVIEGEPGIGKTTLWGEVVRRARLAGCQVLRNSEIAARLFLSGKTVEANLSQAYRKLGIRSRTELATQLTAGKGAAQET